ncbi:MAG: hypothetical protein J1E01_07200 [Acetatifactor sp.]|nr:hypothetical protein [Acetatifactor sp.]
MWNELGISAGTGIIILIALYFVIKWGVKSGIRQCFEEFEKSEILEKLLQHIGYSEEITQQEGEAEEI